CWSDAGKSRRRRRAGHRAGIEPSGRERPGARLMRALVTGGAGFIGSNLVDRLLAEGHSVDVVDNLATGKLKNLADARRSGGHDLTIHNLDVRGPELVALAQRQKPEVVFHIAAQSSVSVSVADPMLDASVNA